MAAAEREHAESGKEIEVAVAVAVEEVRAFGAHVVLVEADRAENLRHLRVHVTLVQREAFVPRASSKASRSNVTTPPPRCSGVGRAGPAGRDRGRCQRTGPFDLRNLGPA